MESFESLCLSLILFFICKGKFSIFFELPFVITLIGAFLSTELIMIFSSTFQYSWTFSKSILYGDSARLLKTSFLNLMGEYFFQSLVMVDEISLFLRIENVFKIIVRIEFSPLGTIDVSNGH